MLATRAHALSETGLRNIEAAHWNLGPARLLEQALQRHEGAIANNGALVVRTGQFTGRSPKDKYIVRESATEHTINWGTVNQPMAEDVFDRLFDRLLAFLEGQEIFLQDAFAGADPEHQLPIRLITQRAWHALFAHQLFIPTPPGDGHTHYPKFTLIFAPGFRAQPAEDGTNSETCIVISFRRGLVIIAGTMYAGEMKKSVFTILNYLLPGEGVFPMHCSANVGANGDTALFFGLSGTGKTTLSADPQRCLVGDDEHGWSDRGIFNFEGGCYAKCIRLSREREPQIWDAIRFGTVLENVAMDSELRTLDFDSDHLTENTRAAYPLEFIDNALLPSVASHPSNILFLTADASGVLPPIARLTPEQAMYHFLSGYTSKLAGTERGLGKEPLPNFSACFGEPFLPRAPQIYAAMLGTKLRRHAATCWLVNTGWIGGAYGIGRRIDLPYTRAMVNAAIEGKLNDIAPAPDPNFGLIVPRICPGVPAGLLDPRSTWADKNAYDRAAGELAARFRANFERFKNVPAEIRNAGPR